MSDSPDDHLKRLFAQAPVVGSDEAFVRSLAIDAVARRRRRRFAWIALGCIAAVALAILLAPLAPVASLSNAGNSLLVLPEQLGTAAESAGRLPGATYVGTAAVVIALLLAGAAWLARRT